MNLPQQFYANRTSNPASLNKAEAIGKFSIFLDRLAASFKHDADPATLIEASTDLESALLGFIKAKVHADYYLECYRLLDDEFSGIAAYYRTMADHHIVSNPKAISLPHHEE